MPSFTDRRVLNKDNIVFDDSLQRINKRSAEESIQLLWNVILNTWFLNLLLSLNLLLKTLWIDRSDYKLYYDTELSCTSLITAGYHLTSRYPPHWRRVHHGMEDGWWCHMARDYVSHDRYVSHDLYLSVDRPIVLFGRYDLTAARHGQSHGVFHHTGTRAMP